MNTTTTKRARQPRPEVKKERTCRLVITDPVGDTLLVIRQTEGKKEAIDTYLVEEIPGIDDGRGILLTKHDGTQYAVNLMGNQSSCDCPDHTYRGHERPCKHIAALLALESRIPPVSKPIPVHVCQMCDGTGHRLNAECKACEGRGDIADF